MNYSTAVGVVSLWDLNILTVFFFSSLVEEISVSFSKEMSVFSE